MIEIIISTLITALGILFMFKVFIKKLEDKSSENNLRSLLEEKFKLMSEDGDKSIEKTFKSIAPEILQSMQDKHSAAMDQKIKEDKVLSEIELKKKETQIDQKLANINAKEQVYLIKQEQALEKATKPITESFKLLNETIKRVDDFERESKSMLKSEIENVKETATKISTIFVSDQKRGIWGEISLRRVLEFSGMKKDIHFKEQEKTENQLIPDVIINLPGEDNVIVIDSKAPMSEYLKSLEATDESARANHLKNFVKQVKDKINDLSKKEYYKQFNNTPELVIMYLPQDSTFHAVNMEDPGLVEYAMKKNILLASPVTLLANLKAIAIGWRQEEYNKHGKLIGEVASELYDRIMTFTSHLSMTGKKLNDSVDSYNSAISSLISRVLPSGRKLGKLVGKESQQIGEKTTLIEQTARDVIPEVLKVINK
jgi:DNA recombination protein RmuC